MFRYGILILLFSLFLFADTLKEVVEKDRFISEGYIGFISYKEKNYLVSVGVSTISDSSTQAKINAMKEAKILAQSDLMKFIHQVKITSKEELITVVITTRDGQTIKQQYNEKLIESIKEQSFGILKNIIDIGKWKKNDEYFYALGIER